MIDSNRPMLVIEDIDDANKPKKNDHELEMQHLYRSHPVETRNALMPAFSNNVEVGFTEGKMKKK